jgi:hypothetical protein
MLCLDIRQPKVSELLTGKFLVYVSTGLPSTLIVLTDESTFRRRP